MGGTWWRVLKRSNLIKRQTIIVAREFLDSKEQLNFKVKNLKYIVLVPWKIFKNTTEF